MRLFSSRTKPLSLHSDNSLNIDRMNNVRTEWKFPGAISVRESFLVGSWWKANDFKALILFANSWIIHHERDLLREQVQTIRHHHRQQFPRIHRIWKWNLRGRIESECRCEKKNISIEFISFSAEGGWRALFRIC